jgi:hypothetical protein
MTRQGLPAGEIAFESANAETGEAIAVLDLAWSKGIQEGYSQPVTLLLDEKPELESIVNQAGYRFFTNVESFKHYVQREILSVTEMELARQDARG